MATGSTDPNARGEDGSTAFHHAVMGEGVGAVESLLEADPAARDSESKTPVEGVKPDSSFLGTEAYRRLGG